MSDEQRSSENIRHFVSRAKQPKILAGGPNGKPNPYEYAAPVNVFLVFDQGFGGPSQQIDDLRFKYMGTSPQLSKYENMSSRKTWQDNMYDSFHY